MDVARSYAERITAGRAELRVLERQYNLVAALRLILFVGTALALWVVLARGGAIGWVLLPVLVFGGLVLVHERLAKRRDRARRLVAWYEQGQARLTHRWAGQGRGGEGFRNPDHLYADDLDLFGRGSLFELLNTTRTAAGERRLAEWLLAPAPSSVVSERQEAVRELAARPDLREDLAVLGAEVGTALHVDQLTRWGGGPATGPALWVRPVAFVLALSNVVTLVAAFAYDLPGWMAALSLGASGLLMALVARPVAEVIRGVDLPSRDLDLMADLLARLEREEWRTPLLRRLGEDLVMDGAPASRRIAGLHRLVGLLDTRRNQLFLPLLLILVWTPQVALAIDRWRRRNGRAIGRWLHALADYEALAALGTYAAEHPTDVFPTMSPGSARFTAEDLAHPLLAADVAVPNTVALDDTERLLVVSGSNMSGKSTLLRAVGINAVLAQTGAPVRARALQLSPLRIGASFRPQDSLQEGRSRFYAEIARLKAIVDLLGAGEPVLFLLDELLSGTNSHDRAIGARAVVAHLVESGAIGLLTTHDLALAGIADALAPRARNVHFEDDLADGALHFDYRLRPGTVTRSNALALMRAVGLNVEDPTPEGRAT